MRDCWEWPGRIGSEGYGMLRQTDYAHRLSYQTFIGPIPDGKQIDHLCRNRACVNPWHMEPVTSRENTLRGEGFTAQNARRTHCLRGHELTGSNVNLRVRSAGDTTRECKVCRSLTRNRARALRSLTRDLARHSAEAPDDR